MELIQAPPIFCKVVIKFGCLAMDVLHELRIIRVHEKKDTVIMEVGICKGKKILEVVRRTLVPLRDGIMRDK